MNCATHIEDPIEKSGNLLGMNCKQIEQMAQGSLTKVIS